VEAILDASALIAFFLREEPGQQIVADAIAAEAGVCTANASEAVGVLVRSGMPADEAITLMSRLPVIFFPVDLALALGAGAMILQTRQFGLSLGDRMCLALAARERVPAITADAVWLKAGPAIGVSVRLIR
jgi:ribonuclease VapC